MVCGSKGGVSMKSLSQKKHLEPDLVAALEFWDVGGKTMKKYHYDSERVDFNEVYADIVRNRSQMGYYSY